MKAKHVFTTLGLALTMGLSVAAGLIGSRAMKEAKAESTAWYVVGEFSGQKKWSHSSGYLMTEESTNTWVKRNLEFKVGDEFKVCDNNDENWQGAWSYKNGASPDFSFFNKDVEDGSNIICKVAGVYDITFTKSDWHIKIEEATSVTKYDVETHVSVDGGADVVDNQEVIAGNLPTINYGYGKSFSGWFDNAACSEGHEVEEITSNTTVYGKVTTLPTVTYSFDISAVEDVFEDEIYYHAWDNGGDEAAWPGTKLTGSTITVANDAKFIISNVKDEAVTVQTVDITQSGVDSDTVIVLNQQDGEDKYQVQWLSTIDDDYSLKVNGSTINFTLNDSGKPAGAEHQYKATIPSAIRAKEIEFYKGENKITEKIGVDYSDDKPVPGNNIVGDVENGFRIYYSTTNMDVYLKTYGDGGMSLWGTGYAENTYYVSGFNLNPLHLDDEFVPDETYIKQYKTSAAVQIAVKAEAAEKYYVSDMAGYTQGITMESAGDNNAVAVTSTTFNVHNACTEVIYLKMKVDLSLVLYIGGRTHARVLTIGGVEHALEAYQPEGEELQYRATGVALTAGQAISYSVDGVATAITAKEIGNNNLQEGLKVLADAESADIYLKASDLTLWVGGLDLAEASGYHLLISNETSHKTSFVKMTQNPDPEKSYEYYTSGHAFKEGDNIKIAYCGSSSDLPIVYNPADGLDDYSDDHFELVSDVVVCNGDVVTNAYIKAIYGHDQLYFGGVESYIAEATNFAVNFLDDMDGVCKTEGQDETYIGKVAAMWQEQVGGYAALSKDARDYLAAATASHEIKEIADFISSYTYIASKYKDKLGAGWDFLNKGISSNAIREVKAINNNALIIILVSTITVISAAGLFLVIRRRKHN